jgi:diguanylate cyclase (GGDEF)-like protein/PAS domain S-box-containing protein
VSDISARKHAERTQRESEDRFRTAFLTSPDAINITRLCDGLYLEVNDGFLQMLGLTREESVGRTSVNLNIWHNPDDRLRLVNALKNTGHCNNLEAVFVAKNGRLMTGSMSAHVIVLQGEECVLTVTRDITERQIAMDQLRKLSQAVEQSTDSIFITNMDAKIEYVNNALLNKTGYPREEVIGENPSIFQSGQTPKETYTELWQSMTQGLVWRGEFFNQRKDGSLYIESAVVSPIRAPDGIITHYVAVKTDITTQKQALERINNLAFYDPLTGLPNRRLLMDRLEQVLATSARHHRHGGLLFVDLDEFKTINETLGHASGDMLLKQVATSLSACLREGDTVARIGGDEFVVLLENLSENELEAATQVESVAENIVTALNHDQKIDNAFYRCTASIGITLFAEHKQTIDDLLKRGELAMYQAKESGRNTLCFFDPEMQTVVMNRVILEADLRDALGDKQFFLCYQAQVRSPSILTGVEALIRWQHPQRGLVSPAEFIPVTEATGLIVPIGRWVLETACLQLSAWALDATMEHLTIAVNVSAKQFHRADFVEDVVAILKRTGARAKRLKLELTESLLVSNIEGVIVKMNALKAIGIGFSLDDFGTGYSSLSYLKRLPLDQLKIDQSFVRDILVDANDAAISKMVIALASTMGLAVIAEGVETEEQRDALIQLGCNAYQGYLYSKPLPVDEFETLVRSQSLQMNFT